MSPQEQELTMDQPVERIMVTDVGTVQVGTTVKEAAALMEHKGYGCLVVVSGNLAIGIVTERDIVHNITAEGIDPSKVLIQDIMSTPLITVTNKSTIRQAAEKMSTYEVRKMVITDTQGRLTGLVTAGDIAHWLAELKDFSDPALNAIARMKRKREEEPYG